MGVVQGTSRDGEFPEEGLSFISEISAADFFFLSGAWIVFAWLAESFQKWLWFPHALLYRCYSRWQKGMGEAGRGRWWRNQAGWRCASWQEVWQPGAWCLWMDSSFLHLIGLTLHSLHAGVRCTRGCQVLFSFSFYQLQSVEQSQPFTVAFITVRSTRLGLFSAHSDTASGFAVGC